MEAARVVFTGWYQTARSINEKRLPLVRSNERFHETLCFLQKSPSWASNGLS